MTSLSLSLRQAPLISRRCCCCCRVCDVTMYMIVYYRRRHVFVRLSTAKYAQSNERRQTAFSCILYRCIRHQQNRVLYQPVRSACGHNNIVDNASSARPLSGSNRVAAVKKKRTNFLKNNCRRFCHDAEVGWDWAKRRKTCCSIVERLFNPNTSSTTITSSNDKPRSPRLA